MTHDTRINQPQQGGPTGSQLAEIGVFSLLQPPHSWFWLIKLEGFYIKFLPADGLLYMTWCWASFLWGCRSWRWRSLWNIWQDSHLVSTWGPSGLWDATVERNHGHTRTQMNKWWSTHTCIVTRTHTYNGEAAGEVSKGLWQSSAKAGSLCGRVQLEAVCVWACVTWGCVCVIRGPLLRTGLLTRPTAASLAIHLWSPFFCIIATQEHCA